LTILALASISAGLVIKTVFAAAVLFGFFVAAWCYFLSVGERDFLLRKLLPSGARKRR